MKTKYNDNTIHNNFVLIHLFHLYLDIHAEQELKS